MENEDSKTTSRFDLVAYFLGTIKFILIMTIFIILWVLWNIFAPTELQFDHYPFIFLTLLLSLQASYAAPIILFSQNRQAEKDREKLEQDLEADLKSEKMLEQIMLKLEIEPEE